MRCPTLSELPPPPPGKTGWPWTEETPQLPATMPDGTPWPRVSIVTPSYNQGRFIEETIRSVLLQGYPDLEYIIIDGGSTDESVEIIRKYEPWLTYWVSEPDRGQSHAINKGFERATGEIVAWLNSDDVYLPRGISHAAAFLAPDSSLGMVYGDCRIIDEQSHIIDTWKPQEPNFRELLFKCFIPQQSVFFRRIALVDVGVLDTNLHFAMDYDLWLRLMLRHTASYLPAFLAQHRKCSGTKTVDQSEQFGVEIEAILDRLFQGLRPDSPLLKSQKDVRAIHYLGQAFLALKKNRIPIAREYFRKALASSQGIFHRERERVIEMLVAYADPGQWPSGARAYLDLVMKNLEFSGEVMQRIHDIALNRLQIINAVRSRRPMEFRTALRSIGTVVLRDWKWVKKKNVLGDLLSLLVGERRIAVLVSLQGGIQRLGLSFWNR